MLSSFALDAPSFFPLGLTSAVSCFFRLGFDEAAFGFFTGLGGSSISSDISLSDLFPSFALVSWF